MGFTFDPSTDLGKVRMLCTDTDPANPLFDDGTIQAFLDVENGVVKLAAAQALDTIANSQALLLKKTVIGDLQTDGPALAAALRAGAKNLRDSLANEVDFDWAEQATTVFGAREILWNDIRRQYY